MRMVQRLSSLRRGASAMQYALILGLIAAVALAAVASTGGRIAALFAVVSNRVSGVGNTTGATGGSGGGGDTAQQPTIPAFAAITGATPGTAVASAPVTVSNFSGALTATASAGALVSLNGGAFAASVANVQAGDQLRLQLTSTLVMGGVASATLTLGPATSPAFAVTSTATIANLSIPNTPMYNSTAGSWVSAPSAPNYALPGQLAGDFTFQTDISALPNSSGEVRLHFTNPDGSGFLYGGASTYMNTRALSAGSTYYNMISKVNYTNNTVVGQVDTGTPPTATRFRMQRIGTEAYVTWSRISNGQSVGDQLSVGSGPVRFGFLVFRYTPEGPGSNTVNFTNTTLTFP